MLAQNRSKRSPTGSRYKSARKKRVFEKAGASLFTKTGEKKIRKDNTRGNTRKLRLLAGDTVIIYNPQTKKHTKVKIKAVVENAANRNFIRRNILTKGVVVETEEGKAKLTSRPGQDGSLNAVLL